jgi:diaminopimelate epimerase
MSLRFTKMHGLGNDFMVLDGINQDVHLTQALITSLSNRFTGIGFDQCLLIEPSTREGIDFNYRIFNADGQEVGQCGNGARCLALFVTHYKLTTKKLLTIATKTTTMSLSIHDDQTVSVAMGVPRLEPKAIPLLREKQAPNYSLPLHDGTSIKFHAINVGNPHAVLVVPEVDNAPVHQLGQYISTHPDFPEQTNTGFMQIINSQHIKLRVYERGCGETQACGSGAVAAAAIGQLFYELDETVKVSLPGGDLSIHWPSPSAAITLRGPATFVYEGQLVNL